MTENLISFKIHLHPIHLQQHAIEEMFIKTDVIKCKIFGFFLPVL